MLVLSIRTDKPEAEIGLYQDHTEVAYKAWLAHRQLAETLHQEIRDLLAAHGKTLQDIEGIICFQGPGSFTGLRIGITVANTLAYALEVPIIAAGNEQQSDWRQEAISHLLTGESDITALPEYGSEANITLSKK